jgi:hypothetical protein
MALSSLLLGAPRINDSARCNNMGCRVRLMCDRVVLRKAVK